MNFSDAINALDGTNKIQRSGWNGKGMFVFLVAGNAWGFETDVSGVDDIDTSPFFCMKTADNKLVPWLASQTDHLSDDWEVIKE